MVISPLLMFLCFVMDVMFLSTQNYMINKKENYQLLPHTYLGIFEGENRGKQQNINGY